jgi:hypothetical protein
MPIGSRLSSLHLEAISHFCIDTVLAAPRSGVMWRETIPERQKGSFFLLLWMRGIFVGVNLIHRSATKYILLIP